MIDIGLLSKVKQIYDVRKPHGVLLSDVLAIIQKESNGVPTFYGSEPLLRMNLNMAISWKAHDGRVLKSGASAAEIRSAISIKGGPLNGLWCKFRFESGYWENFVVPLAAHHPGLWTPAELVLLSSSVGLGQQMLRFVVEKLPADQMLTRANAFMGNVTEQINWVIGNLQSHAGDRQLMFARYNLGGAVKGGKTYHTYGANVMHRAQEIDKWLEVQRIC